MIETADRMVSLALREMVRQEVAAALEVESAKSSAPGAATSQAPLLDIDPHSLVPFAEHVLREASGGPMHVKDMAARIYALGFQHKWPPKHKDQLLRSLNSLASPSQHPEKFERVGPRRLKLR